MECISVPWPVAGRHGDAELLRHRDTDLERGLDLGESVVVWYGTAFAEAVVEEVSFEIEDTLYRLRLRDGLTEVQVAQLLTGAGGPGERVSAADVLALLAELRRRLDGVTRTP